jgi:hypothetical protein
MNFFRFNDPKEEKSTLINLDLMRRIDWHGDNKLIFCDVNCVSFDIVFSTVEEARQTLVKIYKQ